MNEQLQIDTLGENYPVIPEQPLSWRERVDMAADTLAVMLHHSRMNGGPHLSVTSKETIQSGMTVIEVKVEEQ